MKIAIATDHNGVEEKKKIIEFLSKDYEVIDMSPINTPPDDYPTFAFKVGEFVRDNKDSLGILLCGTGIGMSIAANKIRGVRCGHVSNVSEAKLAKFHNNANVIALSYKNDINDILECINAFITTNFTNEERHIRRINLITEYEKHRQNELYKAMMNIIVRANEVIFEEVKGEDMCEALRELFKDEIEAATQKARTEALLEGESKAFIQLLREGILTVADVATRLNITEAEVKELMC